MWPLCVLGVALLQVSGGLSRETTTGEDVRRGFFEQLNSLRVTAAQFLNDLVYKYGDLEHWRTQLDAMLPRIKAIESGKIGLHVSYESDQNVKEILVKMKDAVNEMQKLGTRDTETLIERLMNLTDDANQMAYDVEDELNAETTDAIKNLVNKLVTEWEVNSNEETLRRLPDDVVELIVGEDFGEAKKRLFEFSNKTTVRYVVRRVYDHTQLNYDLLLRFANFLENKPRQFLIYENLFHEMRVNGHGDLLKYFDLIKTVHREIQFHAMTPLSYRNSAKELVQQIDRTIEETGPEILKKIIATEAVNSEESKRLCKEVYDYSTELYKGMVRKVVADMYNVTSTGRLLDFVMDQQYVAQRDFGLPLVFQKMQLAGENDTADVFKLAFYAKRLMDDLGEQIQLSSIRDSLPVSAKNAAFSKNACIFSPGREEYIYAPQEFADEERIRAFTLEVNVNLTGGQWHFEHANGTYYIRSDPHDGYLYATGDYDEIMKKHRPVMLWRRKFLKVSGSRWTLFPQGDDVLIFNEEYQEFLHTNASLFTYIGGKKSRNLAHIWHIVDCDT